MVEELYNKSKEYNFKWNDEFSKWFIDINGGKTIGGDLCFTPQDNYADYMNTTNAECVTFSFPCGLSYGVGVDYYSEPISLFSW